MGESLVATRQSLHEATDSLTQGHRSHEKTERFLKKTASKLRLELMNCRQASSLANDVSNSGEVVIAPSKGGHPIKNQQRRTEC